MRRRALIVPAAALVAACVASTSPPAASRSPAPAAINGNIANPELTVASNLPVRSGGDLELVWSDEFDGPQPDPAKWFFESGDGSQYNIPGWGNNELEWYLPDNARIVHGQLVITAREQAVSGKKYTSARLSTKDRFAFRYGRIEARMRLPRGQGLWPAFWLLPQDNAYGQWAASGEIDIMEAVNLGGTGGNTVYGTTQYGGEWPDNTLTGETYDVPGDPTAGFHVYALEWDREQLRWYVDDVLYATQVTWSTTAAPFPAPFDEPFYILLNLAVGGHLPGPPDRSTAFPATMAIDYVRVWSGQD